MNLDLVNLLLHLARWSAAVINLLQWQDLDRELALHLARLKDDFFLTCCQQSSTSAACCKQDPTVVKKGRWTTAEDKTLTQVMSVEMFKNWPTVALSMGGRTAKQCRERWFCHLSPHVNKDAFTAAEDAAIMSLHARVGNKWARIAACLPGRSETSVKSRIKTLRSTGQLSAAPLRQRSIWEPSRASAA